MILKFDFQRDEVSFFFLLSHPTALPCIRSTDHAVHIRAVHKFLQDVKLLFGAGRHQILPPFRQDGQICDAPLDVLGIVDIGRCQLHQMTHAPADEMAVALKVAVFAAGCAKDFCIGHSDGWLFRHDQFCDKNHSNLLLIAICTAAKCRLKIRWVQYLPHLSLIHI